MEIYKKLGFQNKEQWDFPTIVNLNVFRGECPCNCIHCPVGRVLPSKRYARFKKSEVSLELYKKVSNEIAKHTGSLLRIHSVGEPILWGKLSEAIKYSKNINVKTWIFTSAVTTNNHLLMELCENTDIIEVSVNSVSKEDYLQSKGIDKFELVKNNILFMKNHILTHNLKTRLILSRVQSNNSIMDNEFIKYWSTFDGIADVFIRSYHNYNGLLGIENIAKSIQPCLVHWGRFNIDVNGNAVICFNELFHENTNVDYIIGNVEHESIESIWKSDKLNDIRLFLLNKHTEPVKIPCINCTTRQLYPTKNVTSEKQLNFLK